MIYTDHLEDTIRFYTDVLGFTLAGKMTIGVGLLFIKTRFQ